MCGQDETKIKLGKFVLKEKNVLCNKSAVVDNFNLNFYSLTQMLSNFQLICVST